MRLVLINHWVSEYVASGTETCPIEYESAEALLCDFDEALEAAQKDKKHEFKFADIEFDVTDFIETDFETGKKHKTLPTILTVEEWFNGN